MANWKSIAKRIFSHRPAENQNLEGLYQASLLSLLSSRSRITVVIVGANDGRINDPFFSFASQFPQRTDILLVEPQSALIPHLAKNYIFHPSHQIFNGAIGLEEELTLYSIRPEFWSHFRPPYAKNWPDYRAPTGITSSEQSHVVDWVHKWSKIPPEMSVEKITVPCHALPGLLAKTGFPEVIDVLQIDAEGTDDSVLYSCMPSQTKPRLVFMETKSLSSARMNTLKSFFHTSGFHLYTQGGDSLAINLRHGAEVE